MIELCGVSKAYKTRFGAKVILNNISFYFPHGRSIGVLGINGAGKSTLLRLIAGTELPDAGRIQRKVRISWPLGLSGAFHGSLTGAENVRFVSRIYGADLRGVCRFVEEFSDLGNYLKMPLRTYSSGMRARLSFALSMAIDFDCYLVDELTAVGDEDFKRKCQAEFAERKSRANVIMVSHSIVNLKAHCQAGAILANGTLTYFDNFDMARAKYLENAA